MAATFVVETGAVVADANSYVSEADATQYFDNYGAPSEWTLADSPTREAALREATQYLDVVYSHAWVGIKTVATQSLDWPRSNAEDEDGYAIEDDVIPQVLKDATCVAALKVLQSVSLLPDIETPGDIQKTVDKVGPIMTEVEYVGGSSQLQEFSLITSLVSSIVRPTGRIMRG